MTESEDPDCLDFLKLKHLLCPCVTDAKTITKLLLPLKRLFAQDAHKSFSTPASCKHTAKLHDLCARVREKPHFHWEWSPVKKKWLPSLVFSAYSCFITKLAIQHCSLLVWRVTIQINEQEVIMQHTLPWSQTHYKMMWPLQKTMFINKEKIQIFSQKYSDFQQHYREYKLDTKITVSLNSMVSVRWGLRVCCLMFTKWSQNRTPSRMTRTTSAPVLSWEQESRKYLSKDIISSVKRECIKMIILCVISFSLSPTTGLFCDSELSSYLGGLQIMEHHQTWRAGAERSSISHCSDHTRGTGPGIPVHPLLLLYTNSHIAFSKKVHPLNCSCTLGLYRTLKIISF